MPAPDDQTTPMPHAVPSTQSRIGAADLVTGSTDPDELRRLLDLARERLAAYESFDRTMGENIRRAGELMVETASLREQVRSFAEQSANDRAAFEAARQADRDRYRSLVQTALDQAAAVQPAIDAMVTTLKNAMTQLDSSETPSGEESAPSPTPIPQSDAPVLTEPDAPEPSPDASVPATDVPEPPEQPEAPESPASAPGQESGPEPTGPRAIQVLAHQVPNAKTAIGLQKMLRELDIVSNVDAREFANGELRLAVTTTGPLPDAPLAAWLESNNGEVTSHTATVTEVTFIEQQAR